MSLGIKRGFVFSSSVASYADTWGKQAWPGGQEFLPHKGLKASMSTRPPGISMKRLLLCKRSLQEGACEKQALVDFGCGGSIQVHRTQYRHVLDGISVDILLVIVCPLIPLSVSIGRGHFLC